MQHNFDIFNFLKTNNEVVLVCSLTELRTALIIENLTQDYLVYNNILDVEFYLRSKSKLNITDKDTAKNLKPLSSTKILIAENFIYSIGLDIIYEIVEKQNIYNHEIILNIADSLSFLLYALQKSINNKLINNNKESKITNITSFIFNFNAVDDAQKNGIMELAKEHGFNFYLYE
jgi:hypothetical protein